VARFTRSGDSHFTRRPSHQLEQEFPLARRVLGVFAVTATAALASLALATPAFAHTDTVTAECDKKAGKSYLTVGLTQYGSQADNFLTITVDGEERPAVAFRSTFKEKTWEFDATVEHDFKIEIKAYDDPDGTKKWSKTHNRSTTACVEEAPATSSSVTPPPATTTAEVPSSSVAVPPSTTAAPAPGGSTPEPPLAATGASPLWLLLSGVGLVGAGAGALLLVRRRRA
jgi:LPXTG-motif cell wall-anchored protein